MIDNINYIEDICIQSTDVDSIMFDINDSKSEDFTMVSNDMSETLSEKTCSSFGNDLDAILYDHSTVINSLKSPPYQRSQLEIVILSQLLQSIPDFMCVNSNNLEYICQSAKLVVYANAGETIVKKCSKLHAWYFCLEGSLRREDSCTTLLGPGSYLGTELFNEDTLISDYDLYSNCDDCKLLVIGSEDLRPYNQLNNLIIKTSDDDKSVIAVYEAHSNLAVTDDMCSYVLVKGTQEVLISHLFSNPKWVSEYYVEDFFLTSKQFLNTTSDIRTDITNSLVLEKECAKEKFDILLRWISQNFPSFEKDQKKFLFMENIIKTLKNQNNNQWLYMLYECCSNSSKVRDIKDIISLNDNVYSLNVTDQQTLFYIHNFNDFDLGLHNGDVIIELEGHSQETLTVQLITSFSEEHRPLSISVKNDLLGYHEHVLKDICIDSVSVHSTPSNNRYSHSLSDKMYDAMSMSNDSDSSYNNSVTEKGIPVYRKSPNMPTLFSTLHSGTVGRFFKNPKHYAKSTTPNTSRSNSDVTTRLESLQNGSRDLVGSTFSVWRFSKRIKPKRQRRSVGSNPDLIKIFDDLEVRENNYNSTLNCPIRIYLKDAFISFVCHISPKTDLKFFHLVVQPTTTVNEVIVRTLLKLSLSSISTSSNEFYLVEVKVNESNGMIHEKILHPNTSNLIDRLKEHCRFYLKHRSFVGESLILKSEAEKMREEFKFPILLQLSMTSLVIRLFLRSYKLLCQIQPDELVDHVTNNKSTLKLQKGPVTSKNRILEYMHLSDFYKYWVMTEICSSESNTTRAATIQYFIHLALRAIYIGHIDLFFSIISGIESVEVTKLNLSWEKVSKSDKKLLQNLKTTLDVSGNMRNLRIIHQKMESPLIPVTAMTIKDLTMVEETHPTYASGTINGLQVNSNLVNFDKMTKMSRIARHFVNSSCSCCEDRSRPVMKHMAYCTIRRENHDNLIRLLKRRLDSHSDTYFQRMYSENVVEKPNRKYSLSNISVQSSSTESLSELDSTNEEKCNCRAYEQLMMVNKIERYLKSLEERVIVDPVKLAEISLLCEPGNLNYNSLESKFRKSSKASKLNHIATMRLSKGADVEMISEKAAEILGLKEKSKIHRYKSQ